MGQIQQALSRLMTTSVMTEAGVKKADEVLNKKTEGPENEAAPNKNEELSMDQVYSRLMTTGATATDLSKGFAQYRRKQRDDFRKRLEESKHKEGDQ